MNYYSLNKYLKNTFGEKVYKISLNGNMTCPNRDGCRFSHKLKKLFALNGKI